MKQRTPIAVVCTAITSFTALLVQAEATPGARIGDPLNAGDGIAIPSAGNGFTPRAGGQGLRMVNFSRLPPGEFATGRQGHASDENGSADRIGGLTRTTAEGNGNTGFNSGGADSAMNFAWGPDDGRMEACNTAICGSR